MKMRGQGNGKGISLRVVVWVLAVGCIGAAVVASLRWDFSAKIVPLVVGTVALCAAALSLFNEMCRKPATAAAEGLAEHAQHEVGEKIHMDLTSDTGHLPVREIVMRASSSGCLSTSSTF